MEQESLPNKPEAVEKISGLLRGQPAETPEPTPAAETPPQDVPRETPEEPQALTPASLAETLGLKPADVYAQLMIPVDGGDAMTLSEFKDKGVELRGLKAAQDELAEQKVTFENNVMMQRQTLKRAMESLPAGSLTPELIKHVQEEQQNHITQERNALHTVRPDLRDPAKWDATRELLVEHLKPYGFLPVEIDSITDHRLAKYVIDNAERQQRVEQLNADGLPVEETPKLQAPSRKPQGPSRRAETDKPKGRQNVAETNQDKAAKVAQLLGSSQ